MATSENPLVTAAGAYPEPEEQTKDSSIYKDMEYFGTTGATSMQRVLPTVLLDRVQWDKLSESELSALDNITGRIDLSDQPVEGDMTNDLFLAHRDEKQLDLLRRRRRRRELELLKGLFGQELADELNGLRGEDDAESETSVIEPDHVTWIGEDGVQTKFSVDSHPPAQECSEACGASCLFKVWFAPNAAADNTSPVMYAPENVKRNVGVFIYEKIPSNHIRVLEIYPGNEDEPISSKLHVLGLDSIPACSRDKKAGDDSGPREYEALSYSWGTDEIGRSIEIDGQAFPLRPNAYKAIRRLRLSGKSRFLWVDAICINQNDKEERNDQVRRMMKIYQRALRVVIWLGQSTETEDALAITLAKALGKKYLRRMLLDQKHEDECMRTLTRAHDALCAVFARPWFRRTWIRQELASGRKVIVKCGKESISWSMLKRSYSRLSDVRQKLQESGTEVQAKHTTTVPTMEFLKRGWIYGQTAFGCVAVSGSLYYWHGGGLLDLLITGACFEVTDDRDRIYAVLGMAREPVQLGDNEHALWPYTDTDETFEPMTVDYNSSVSEVYQRLAKTLINRDLNLDILCILRGQSEPADDMPSWTPDWRQRRLGESSDYLQFRFFASGYARAEHQNHSDLGRLKVKAYAIDVVEELLDVTASAWDLLYENGEAIILSNGAMENRTSWRQKPVFSNLDMATDGRCCCKTGRGRVALVPLGVRVGDILFVILGARLPFVLRSATQTDVKASLEPDGLALSCELGDCVVIGPSCLPGFMQVDGYYDWAQGAGSR